MSETSGLKVLFLDIDGVLNSWQSAYWQNRHGKKGPEILCPIALSNLDELMLKNPDLKIVISSTWKRYHSRFELTELFFSQGFKHRSRIIGCTPDLNRSEERWDEIESWMKVRKEEIEIDKFLILDDNPVVNPGHPFEMEILANMIQTDPKVGFSWWDLLTANQHFEGSNLGVCLM
jgi:hypothetical protein